ncbi:MAG: hypothetical protein K0R54_1451 [Clostridiaceae bacterium]|jgi:hypothetical protein|nr:hypothetical protein [Clostridiaceae bacterium]
MKYKIGSEIEFTNNFEVNCENGKKASIAKGDKAIVSRKVDETSGEIIYTTGNAKGLIQIINIQVDDELDADLIAKKILSQL